MIMSLSVFSGLIWLALVLTIATPVLLLALLVKDFISNQVW
ncbi:hypothetical protein SAMN06297229_1485 [Pseudidiomarina planktonica]|uniref:Uncharacterized protein n=1 Tax=Pseudidiomarina planktonica TaxID=1323738 RepID=A0A1Y6EU88_9GAMM|nr:hypothetical protein [Pseudidiomarina planktonica]SMQ66284.1 hypothetical protein SAMN06297229_1485 [Pseudidiomarina planktonica]